MSKEGLMVGKKIEAMSMCFRYWGVIYLCGSTVASYLHSLAGHTHW